MIYDDTETDANNHTSDTICILRVYTRTMGTPSNFFSLSVKVQNIGYFAKITL